MQDVSVQSLSPSAVRRLRILLWLLCLTGFAINCFLAVMIAAHERGGAMRLPGYSAGGFDCQSVLSSPYSQVLGWSLTYWGLAFYVVFLAALSCERRWRPVIALNLPVLAAPALVTAAWCTFVMHVRLQEY